MMGTMVKLAGSVVLVLLAVAGAWDLIDRGARLIARADRDSKRIDKHEIDLSKLLVEIEGLWALTKETDGFVLSLNRRIDEKTIRKGR